MKGRVFDVQRFCVHDGPGIRTTVFLAGCSLRCAWCHNPESFAGASARWRTPDDVLAEVLQDRDYYATSGGGLTVSGGEPLLQADFVHALLSRAKGHGLHTCVQTAGEVTRGALEAVLEVVDLFQFDLKQMNSARHLALTGAGNERILENAAWLASRGAPVDFRLPLVPGYTDDDAHLASLARFLRSLGVSALQLVPYQRLYLEKYAQLGLTPRLPATLYPGVDLLERAAATLASLGIEAACCG